MWKCGESWQELALRGKQRKSSQIEMIIDRGRSEPGTLQRRRSPGDFSRRSGSWEPGDETTGLGDGELG